MERVETRRHGNGIRLVSLTRIALCTKVTNPKRYISTTNRTVGSDITRHKMNAKEAKEQGHTWAEAMSAGVLPHECIERVKQRLEQSYPDGSEENQLDGEIMREII